MCTVLQESEDVVDVIAKSDARMAALDCKNAQANQIVWVACMVLRVIFGTLTT